MYKKSEKLAKLGSLVISEHEELDHLKECRIVYLVCDREKKSGKKETYADTEVVREKYKALIQSDFIITFYEPMCLTLSERAAAILMYHELRHVGFDSDTKRAFLIPHDLEDFKTIIDEFGTDWVRELSRKSGDRG